MKEFLILILIWIAVFALFSGLMGAAANAYGRYQCEQYAQVTGRATHYVNFDGCYVQRDGKWMRWDEYKLAYATAGDAK